MSPMDRMSKTLIPTFVGAFLALIVFGAGCSRDDMDAESVREQYARFVDLSGLLQWFSLTGIRRVPTQSKPLLFPLVLTPGPQPDAVPYVNQKARQ